MSTFIFLLFLLLLPQTLTLTPPIATPWPPQFHALLYANYSNSLSLIDLYYDFPNGFNANLIRHQLASSTLFDLEWTNGTSFLFYRGVEEEEEVSCRTLLPGVGVLRPDWMDGARYLGREMVDGFECDVWEKVDFIWYYEDVVTKRPVHWLFYTGRSVHVMTYEVGVVLEDEKRQAPAYCFNKVEKEVEIKQGQRYLGAFDAGDNDLRSLAGMTTTYSNQ